MHIVKNLKKLFDFNLYFAWSELLWNSNEIWWNLDSIDKLNLSDEKLKNDIKEKCGSLRGSEIQQIVSRLSKINEPDIKNIFDQIQWPLTSYEVEEFLEKLYFFSSPDDYIQNDIIWNDWIDSSKLSPKQKEFYEWIVSLREKLSWVQSSKEYFGKMEKYLSTELTEDLKAEIKTDIEKDDPTIWLFISFVDKIYNKVKNLNWQEAELSKEILSKLYVLRNEISNNWVDFDDINSENNKEIKETKEESFDSKIWEYLETIPSLKDYFKNEKLRNNIIDTIKEKLPDDFENVKELSPELKKEIDRIVKEEKNNFDSFKKILENPNDAEANKKYLEEIVASNPNSFWEKLLKNESNNLNSDDIKNPFLKLLFKIFEAFGFKFNNKSEASEYFSKIWEWLWSLSEKFESGWKWPNAINFDDKWNSSFWTYQMQVDALEQFSKDNWIDWFKKWVLNEDSEFTKNWNKKVEELWVEKFKKLEHNFIKKTHFDVQLSKINSILPNAWKFSLSTQNVIWSVSVQHWPNTNLITDVISKWDYKPWDLNSEKKLIEEIYNVRRDKYSKYTSRYNTEEAIAKWQLWANIRPKNYVEKWDNNWSWYSSWIERSSTWTTLCSKTARLNLSRLWIKNPAHWSSAKKSFESLSWKESLAVVLWNSKYTVADIYLDASENNKEYWHRAVARKEWDKWYIYDPYYNISWRDWVEANTYIKHMEEVKWRRFWQAKGY